MSKRSRRGPRHHELANHRPPAPAPRETLAKARTASTPYKPPMSSAEQERKKAEQARRVAITGFALCGALVGSLIGLNHWTEAPSTVTSELPLTVWLGAELGVLRLDWVRALMIGVLGLVAGGALGSALGPRLTESAVGARAPVA